MKLLASMPIRNPYTFDIYSDYYEKVTFRFTASVRASMRQQLINDII